MDHLDVPSFDERQTLAQEAIAEQLERIADALHTQCEGGHTSSVASLLDILADGVGRLG